MRKLVILNNKLVTFSKKSEVNSELFMDIKTGKWGQFVFLDEAMGRLKTINVRVAKRAKCDILLLIKKQNRVDCRLNIELAGQGAYANVSGIFHGKKTDRHDFSITTRHRTEAAKSDILIKGVYEQESQATFSGRINIEPTAQENVANFASRILLLDRAAASSKPTLEIYNQDAKASHSSTTAQLDPLQLFYLCSRGLSTRQARQAIIQGFFQPIYSRLSPQINNSIKK